jgi:hypothetical protein
MGSWLRREREWFAREQPAEYQTTVSVLYLTVGDSVSGELHRETLGYSRWPSAPED